MHIDKNNPDSYRYLKSITQLWVARDREKHQYRVLKAAEQVEDHEILYRSVNFTVGSKGELIVNPDSVWKQTFLFRPIDVKSIYDHCGCANDIVTDHRDYPAGLWNWCKMMVKKEYAKITKALKYRTPEKLHRGFCIIENNWTVEIEA